MQKQAMEPAAVQQQQQLEEEEEINMEDGDWSKLPLRVTALWWFMKKTGKLIRRSDGTVNRRLLALFLKTIPASAKPKHGVSTADHVIDAATGVWVRVFTPAPSSSSTVPVILFFHGGGFCSMSAADEYYDTVCRKLASSVPAVVVSVEYRLAPEHKFPAAYDDGAAALGWLASASARAALPESADVGRCVLMGDNSGGNIVHHVGLRHGKGTIQYSNNSRHVNVAGHVVLHPGFGGDERSDAEKRLDGSPVSVADAVEWCWRAFLPAGATRDHPCSNVMLGRLHDDGVQFPPSLVVIAGLDTLKDWQMRYVRFLRSGGNSARVLYYKDALPGAYLVPRYALASHLLADVCSFIRSVCDSSSS